MTILSADALAIDPEGMARLRAVLATDDGYENRCAAVARRMVAISLPLVTRRNGGASLRRRSMPIPALRRA
ncbi:hypothetical protein GCM10007036_44320 [Alsobacter metallidurans]|uniref:Uncharacterized protein n=1 Tax=Alsobacter metallidurans TaxID=340221 RepID=A0A917MLV8_9HYPH|nr:hypothetical protein [Alsobacter metallidurans]GGH32449.1 hypothetical protein GCM10007036_44320 [Alsobacter metallidurans]